MTLEMLQTDFKIRKIDWRKILTQLFNCPCLGIFVNTEGPFCENLLLLPSRRSGIPATVTEEITLSLCFSPKVNFPKWKPAFRVQTDGTNRTAMAKQ